MAWRSVRGTAPVVRLVRRAAAVVLVLATSLAGCGGGGGGSGDGDARIEPSLNFTRPTTVLESGSPGDVLSKEPIELAPELRGTGWKVAYVSTTPSGDRIPVSGVLIQPLTQPPPGGYPVVVWTHGTTGIGDACAPSATTPFELPGAASLLDAGDVIAAPDYEGLGVTGEVHPYLVGASEGRSALDAARAARTVGAGAVTVTWGWSQGGHASLFARELQPDYAPEIDYRGAAAQAPVTDVAALLAGATDLDIFPFVALALVSWSEVYDEVVLADLVVDADAEKARRAQQACNAEIVDRAARPFDDVLESQLDESAPWQEALRINSVGVGTTTAPVLLTHGDADPAVPVGGTVDLFGQLCANDVPTQFIRQPNGDHFSAWVDTIDDVTEWIAGRLAGQKPPSDCP